MWTDCPHADKEIRRKINAANVPMCAWQCVTCGASLSAWLPKKDWPVNPPPWDEGAWERWYAPQREAAEAHRQEIENARSVEAAEWWARYTTHMASPAWRSIAYKVRMREGSRCQGCGADAPNGHCHHADYTRLGDEMLFDLRWLCRACHQKLHPHRTLSPRTA